MRKSILHLLYQRRRAELSIAAWHSEPRPGSSPFIVCIQFFTLFFFSLVKSRNYCAVVVISPASSTLLLAQRNSTQQHGDFLNVFSTCRGYDEHNITITIEDGSPDIVSYMDIHVHFPCILNLCLCLLITSYISMYFQLYVEKFP